MHIRNGWAAGSTDISIVPAAPPTPGRPSEPELPSNPLTPEAAASRAAATSPATVAPVTFLPTVVDDLECSAVGIDQIERLATAADYLDLQQRLRCRFHPGPDLDCLSRAAVPTVAAVAAVVPARAVASRALLGGYACDRIGRCRSAIGACRSVHSVTSIESIHAVSTREIGGERDVVMYRDVEIRSHAGIRDWDDVKMSDLPLAYPRVGRQGHRAALTDSNRSGRNHVIVQGYFAVTRADTGVLLAVTGCRDDYQSCGLSGSERHNRSAALINERG